MKKNLKACIPQMLYEKPSCILDMNDFQRIEEWGMRPDLRHTRSAHVTAEWDFSEDLQIRIPLPDPDLSPYRFLTFSLFAQNGEGGSFHLRFESDREMGGESGYTVMLPICRNGWNDFRLELPFLQAKGDVQGWEHIRAIVLDCVIGGQANSTATVLSFDSLFAWVQDAPRLYMQMPELKGAALFSKTAPYAIVDRKRLPIAPDADPDARPFEEGGLLWLPMSAVAAVLGHKAVTDNKAFTLSFTYRRRAYTFYGNSDRCLVDGEEATLPFRPAVRGGMLFFPANYLRDFFHWRQIFTDRTGLILLSNRKNAFDSKRDEPILWKLNAEITLAQPSAEEILSDLHRFVPNPDRGRLLLSPDEWMAKRRLAKTDDTLKGLLDAVKAKFGKNSEAYLASPVLSDGVSLSDRLDTLIARTVSFAALFRMTGDKLYARRALDECAAASDRSDWEADVSMLTAAKTGLAVSLAYDWCHTAWSEGEKARVERALLRYLMRPGVECYLGRRPMWRVDSSTSAVINCGLLASALALADIYPETALRILRHAPSNLSHCFEVYAPDGGYSESVVGWEKATRALVLSIAMLESATGRDYGFSRLPGFLATALFPIYTETACGAWNYHAVSDAPIDTAVHGWFSRRLQDTSLSWLRQNALLSKRKEANVLDLVWYASVDPEDAPSFPLDALYRKAGLVALRAGFGNEDTLLALHGGHNHTPGGELDAGSFLLEMGGQRFFAETGGCEALPRMLRQRAEGQNTLVIDPVSEPMPDQNPEALAAIVEARSAQGHAYAVVDMTSTSDALIRAKRGILLTSDRTVAVIQDELTLATSATVLWSAYTRATVKHISARTLILEQNGVCLLCKLCGAGSAKFQISPVGESGFSRLTVEASADGKFRMAVACKVFAEGEDRTQKLYECRPMSTWAI